MTTFQRQNWASSVAVTSFRVSGRAENATFSHFLKHCSGRNDLNSIYFLPGSDLKSRERMIPISRASASTEIWSFFCQHRGLPSSINQKTRSTISLLNSQLFKTCPLRSSPSPPPFLLVHMFEIEI